MKRNFLFLRSLAVCLFLFTKATSFAEVTSVDSLHISFGVSIIDPSLPGNGQGKSPVVPPSVSIDDHTLYLYSGCAGATLQVVNALGVAVYTEELYETTTEVELPETLVGEYELQILRGNFCFYATIEL